MHKDTEYVFFEGFLSAYIILQAEQKGIAVKSLTYGTCPDEVTELYTLSRPLTPVLQRALKKSDNLSAEAMFYHLGIHRSGKKV